RRLPERVRPRPSGRAAGPDGGRIPSGAGRPGPAHARPALPDLRRAGPLRPHRAARPRDQRAGREAAPAVLVRGWPTGDARTRGAMRSLPTPPPLLLQSFDPTIVCGGHSTIDYLSSASAGNAVTAWPRKPEKCRSATGNLD